MPKRKTGFIYEGNQGRIWFRLTYIDRNTGKQHEVRRIAENRTKAHQQLKNLISDLELHGAQYIQADALTFGEVAEEFKSVKIIDAVYSSERKVAGLRSKSYATHIKPLIENFNNRPIKYLTVSDIQNYKLMRLKTISRRSKTISIATVNRELSLLRSIFNYAQSEGWVARSPFDMKGFNLISMADEAKRHRVLSHTEEKRLLADCQGVRKSTYIRDGKRIAVNIEYDYFDPKADVV